jgi:HEAT repeat protein
MSVAAGPVYFCWSCYGQVTQPSGRCPHCGGEISPPRQADYAERLIWALRHPLAQVRLSAVEVLGRRREPRAVPPLRDLVQSQGADPYLAAAALAALVRIQGTEACGDLLRRAADSGTAPLRRLARSLLAEAAGTEP